MCKKHDVTLRPSRLIRCSLLCSENTDDAFPGFWWQIFKTLTTCLLEYIHAIESRFHHIPSPIIAPSVSLPAEPTCPASAHKLPPMICTTISDNIRASTIRPKLLQKYRAIYLFHHNSLPVYLPARDCRWASYTPRRGAAVAAAVIILDRCFANPDLQQLQLPPKSCILLRTRFLVATRPLRRRLRLCQR